MGADSATIIAIVSLVISITAFIVAVAQALQQYAASAEGYAKCQKSVMGHWASLTQRRFVWSEFRFDTHFETPVFFLAPPDNKRGPIAGRPIHNIEGTAQSYSDTLTMSLTEQKKEQEAAASSDALLQKVHTADDERASWTNLLETLQKSEKESREWDGKLSRPPKGSPIDEPKYSMVVQVQSRRRNWDFMPESVLRPYATSTVSHIAELAVSLGMIWRAFDADSWNLRAEGNGLSIISSFVQGLGVYVTFAITGRSNFGAEKTIPSLAIKELVFGSVPTIINQFSLNFGSEQDIQRTFRGLKCKPNVTEKYFLRRTHVRSIAFELIAMIGDVARLRGSNFKRIPNPTRDPWNRSLSACIMMREFQSNLSAFLANTPLSPRTQAVFDSWRDIQGVWKDRDDLIDLEMREAVHNALDTCTSFLLECGSESIILIVREHIVAVLNDLNDKESFLSSQDCDTEEEIFEYYFQHIYPRIMGLYTTTQAGNLSVPSAPADRRGSVLPKAHIELRGDIWLTLMYRMCLWWLLHDFDESDIMILPPRLKGSRLPVFIA